MLLAATAKPDRRRANSRQPNTITRVCSKLKVQNSSTFQGLSRTQTVFFRHQNHRKKPYPRCRHSKFRLQCDTEVTCIQVLASKLSTNAKFQNLRDLHSRTFQVFSSTFKHLICFKALSRALKFLFQIQAFSRISQAHYEPCITQAQTLPLVWCCPWWVTLSKCTTCIATA